MAIYKDKLDFIFPNPSIPKLLNVLEQFNEIEWRVFVKDFINGKDKELNFLRIKGNSDMILALSTVIQKLSPLYRELIISALPCDLLTRRSGTE